MSSAKWLWGLPMNLKFSAQDLTPGHWGSESVMTQAGSRGLAGATAHPPRVGMGT